MTHQATSSGGRKPWAGPSTSGSRLGASVPGQLISTKGSPTTDRRAEWSSGDSQAPLGDCSLGPTVPGGCTGQGIFCFS